jgi:hypothetical protein
MEKGDSTFSDSAWFFSSLPFEEQTEGRYWANWSYSTYGFGIAGNKTPSCRATALRLRCSAVRGIRLGNLQFARGLLGPGLSFDI